MIVYQKNRSEAMISRSFHEPAAGDGKQTTKINGWNTKTTTMWKGKSSSKPSFLGWTAVNFIHGEKTLSAFVSGDVFPW